jgi:hypothetical protein
MTHRNHFFQVCDNTAGRYVPFFPDLTDWYMAHRIQPGDPFPFEPGQYIPVDAEINKLPGNMPEQLRDQSLPEIYRSYNWGQPVHIYDWFRAEYSGKVRYEEIIEGKTKIRRFITPRGNLEREDHLSDDGSWGPISYYVKDIKDLDIMRVVIEHTSFVPQFDNVNSVLTSLDGNGVGDLPVMRSPFGKLVHEYMGFQNVVFALFDHPQDIVDFLAFQEQKDLEQVKLAAESPGRVVIISDHADENLIAPPYFKDYCIPYYHKAQNILHNAGKLVSTHWDGNHKGLFPLLPDCGFDILDGCTPAPMNNYEVEELAEALPDGMVAWLGVPSCLFCQGVPTEEILAFGQRIIDALAGRVILNVGDILPPNGDFSQVVALGELVAEHNLNIE